MNFKKKIVQFNIDLINIFNIDHILIGNFIRAFHYNIPIYLFIFICLLSKNYCKFILYFLILCIIIPFILFNGCWISSLENKLLKDNINITDLFLHLLNININNKNRYNITLITCGLYTLLLFFIYYFRFIL